MSVESASQNVTALLQAAELGDRDALESCFPLVYDELRVIARKQRRAWQGNLTLPTTALLHQANLKLVDQQHLGATSREHFFAIAATAMRHILCSYARDRGRAKRGGGMQQVSLTSIDHVATQAGFSEQAADLLVDLSESLDLLAQIDKRHSQVVECRFFAGMSVDETALALDISPATVKRSWTFARAWLMREMQRRGE